MYELKVWPYAYVVIYERSLEFFLTKFCFTLFLFTPHRCACREQIGVLSICIFVTFFFSFYFLKHFCLDFLNSISVKHNLLNNFILSKRFHWLLLWIIKWPILFYLWVTFHVIILLCLALNNWHLYILLPRSTWTSYK
jgi:hypothetical protein